MTTPDGTDNDQTQPGAVPLLDEATRERIEAEDRQVERAANRAARVRHRMREIVDPSAIELLERIGLRHVLDTIVMLLCEEIETP